MESSKKDKEPKGTTKGKEAENMKGEVWRINGPAKNEDSDNNTSKEKL